MWFMNMIANPFVCLMLRSPFHRMVSATLLLITYIGRKSGEEHTLPVQYVQEERVVNIIPGAPEQKIWWRNLRGGAPVRLLLAGKVLTGKATVLVGDSEAARITRALALYFRRFPDAAKLHNICSAGDGSLNQNDLRRQVPYTVVVQVELSQ